ncbi:ribbon-helix-helix protein, CopG family [Comamonas guangdongensis]|uniref:Ribbon-helix-helix protein, CopG family n=1 Tax=Comamonas guangdongensis TaxID=510515 RepID=A0ABV3ZU42_9BURK
MLVKKPTKGRPPASKKTKGVWKGERLQISHTITPDLLSKVDQLAAAMGQSRAAVINLAIYRLLEQEFHS